MRKISCIIVDDEPLALDLLERYIRDTPFLLLAGRCATSFEAIQVIGEVQVDLLFLDIQMPGMDGVTLSRMVSKDQKIIFTTAFEKYAMDGFRVEALDFLLKPFDFEEFFNAANKAKKWFELVHKSEQSPLPQEYVFVRSDYKQVKLPLKDVLYIEGVKDYVKIWQHGGKEPIMSQMSMKSFEQGILPPERFLRIHRSFIIALDKISYVERGQVIINDFRITIGEAYKDRFMSYMAGRSFS